MKPHSILFTMRHDRRTLVADVDYLSVIGTRARGKDRVELGLSNAGPRALRDDLVPIFADTFAKQPTSQWLALLEAGDVPCAPVNRLEEVFEDPQVTHSEMLLRLEHPRHGHVYTVNNPVHLLGTPVVPFGYPPDRGEHTDQILTELGHTDDIAALRAMSVFA